MSDNLSKEKGDFHKFHRPEAGSRTVEGNTSGARAMRLEQQRLQDHKEFETAKQKKLHDSQHASLNIHSKFQSARIGSVEEQAFKAKTAGLVTAEDLVKATNAKERQTKELSPEELKALKQKEELEAKKKAKKLKRKPHCRHGNVITCEIRS